MKKKLYLIISGAAIAVLISGYYISSNSKTTNNTISTNSTNSTNSETTNNASSSTEVSLDASNKEDAKIQADEQNKKNEEDAKEAEKRKEEEKSTINGAKPVKADVAENTVKKLIDIVYFKKGSYDEYKSLFALTDRVATKEKFEDARSKANTVDKFGKQYKNSDEIVKQFKTEKTDNLTKVIFKSEDGQKESVWQIIEKDGKYLIYNAVIQ